MKFRTNFEPVLLFTILYEVSLLVKFSCANVKVRATKQSLFVDVVHIYFAAQGGSKF